MSASDKNRVLILHLLRQAPGTDIVESDAGGAAATIDSDAELEAVAIDAEEVAMTGVEAGGEGIIDGKHAARFQGGGLGVLQGTRSFVLQDEDGQIQLTHSVSAGLDYAAVGPEHAWLRDADRVQYTYATDAEALAAFQQLAKLEGIIPALESSHAIAEVIKAAPKMSADQIIIVNLSGRGDKDVAQVAEMGIL